MRCPCGGYLPGRAAQGSVALRKMACLSRSRGVSWTAAQGHQLAHRGGAARSLPLQIESKMDAKARDLTLLAALSLFCAMVTWAGDRDILGSAFFAFGIAAIWGAGLPHRRSHGQRLPYPHTRADQDECRRL